MSDTSNFLTEHFTELDTLLRQYGAETGICEAHGLSVGLVCRGQHELTQTQWCELLAVPELKDAILDTLQGIHGLAMRALHSQELAFDPLLPDDNVEIKDQVDSLSEWCAGFLRGFLSTGKEKLDETCQEAIDDISSISNLEMDDDDLDSQERSLFELREYLRIAVQILFEQFKSQEPVSSMEN
ncbi:MAG: hypothetical protein ACI8P9_000527 [Parasphingorhabdus sp.]|jgi:uncharacterized protein YgfB (UPF0149 family)